MAKPALKTHADIFETTRNGRPAFRLLCDDQLMEDFFDSWAYQLSGKYSYRTVKTYCYAVCQFLNYIMEIASQKGDLTSYLLMDALDSYESFLAFGIDSESEIASSAARSLGSRSLSGSSIETHFAAVNRFIDESENLRIALMQLEDTDYISSSTASSISLPVSKYEATPSKVKAAIKSKSWLAGCISGGYKRIKRSGLKPRSKASIVAHTDEFGGDSKAFPIDKCRELIKCANGLRDKVLWSLLAASGMRISEALTIFIDDIVIDTHDPRRNKILIVNPETRYKELIRYIPEKKIKKLSHKGRTTQETFLIEPFASMFWRYLDEYIQDERKKERKRVKVAGHRFLFKNMKDGTPMPLSYQSVFDRFNEAAIKITGQSYGFHSLRHMYGYYLANHCPNPNPTKDKPFGLNERLVQNYMGHRSIETTKQYARMDMKMIEVTLAAVNMIRMDDPFFSVTNVRIKHLESQIEELEKLQNKKGDQE